jgi:hypothetical protein
MTECCIIMYMIQRMRDIARKVTLLKGVGASLACSQAGICVLHDYVIVLINTDNSRTGVS